MRPITRPTTPAASFCCFLLHIALLAIPYLVQAQNPLGRDCAFVVSEQRFVGEDCLDGLTQQTSSCSCFISDPCLSKRCPAHPEARCVVMDCCKAEFFVGNTKVDCQVPETSLAASALGQTGPCGCSRTGNTVCGADGKEHVNSCAATCAGVIVACNHPCPACNEKCKGKSCAAHPDAVCQINPCKCKPEFFKNGAKVSCDGPAVSQTGVDPACSLDPVSGPCKWGLYGRWYYDKLSNVCTIFPGGNCGQNNNNFESISQCRERCGIV